MKRKIKVTEKSRKKKKNTKSYNEQVKERNTIELWKKKNRKIRKLKEWKKGKSVKLMTEFVVLTLNENILKK